MEGIHATGQTMPEASRFIAAGGKGRITPCCCSRRQRPVWRTHSGLHTGRGCGLCRVRHNPHNAEFRIMPSSQADSIHSPGFWRHFSA